MNVATMVVVVSTLLAVWPGRTNAAGPAPAGLPAKLENCVGGPALALGTADGHALLDDAERDLVQAAALARFPALQSAPFAPSRIALWHKRSDEWIYIALIPSRDKPGSLCFVATFTASGFDFTPALQRKYFFAGSLRT